MPSYELTIKLDGLSSTKEETNKEQLQQTNSPEKNTSTKPDVDAETAQLKTTVTAAAGVMAAKEAKKLVSQAVTAYVSNIGARTDNQARQNQINNGIKTFNRATSVVSSIVSGAAAGAAFGGPAGAAIGAGIALVGSAVSMGIEFYQNAEQYDRDQKTAYLQAAKNYERIQVVTTNRR